MVRAILEAESGICSPDWVWEEVVSNAMQGCFDKRYSTRMWADATGRRIYLLLICWTMDALSSSSNLDTTLILLQSRQNKPDIPTPCYKYSRRFHTKDCSSGAEALLNAETVKHTPHQRPCQLVGVFHHRDFTATNCPTLLCQDLVISLNRAVPVVNSCRIVSKISQQPLQLTYTLRISTLNCIRHHFTFQVAKMGYSDLDWKAINTIRLLAVCYYPAMFAIMSSNCSFFRSMPRSRRTVAIPVPPWVRNHLSPLKPS